MATSTLKGGIEYVSVTWESGYQDGGGTNVFIKDGILYVNLTAYKPAGSLPTTLTKVATLSKIPKNIIVLSGIETDGNWKSVGTSIAHISSGNGQVAIASTGATAGRIVTINGTGPV